MKRFLALSLLVACSTTRSPAPPAVTPIAAVAAAPEIIPNETVLQLAAHRAQLIGWLHDYREAGVFPTDATGRPISVFVDARGVRCPMAELLHKSGRDDLVAAVAREANTVRLGDVHEGTLHDWMLGSGLTRDEIALVQGVMNIDLGWMQRETEAAQILAARAQIRGKLETAEVALRDNTGTSLAAAVRMILPQQRPSALTVAPVRGAVVPKAAIPAPVVPVAQGIAFERRQFVIRN